MAVPRWWQQAKDAWAEVRDYNDAARYFRSFHALMSAIEDPTPAVAAMAARASRVFASHAARFDSLAHQFETWAREVRAVPAPPGALTTKARVLTALEHAYHDARAAAETYRQLAHDYHTTSIDMAARISPRGRRV